MEPVLAFKLTAELDAAKFMTRYIEQQYSEAEAAKHREACHEFAEQREALRLAVREDRVTLEQLQQYYHYLDCVAAHFPVSASATKLSFVWHDSLSPKKKCAQHNIALERSATVFNMATAYAAQAARHKQLMSEDGTKQAAGNFLWAAACFRELRTAFVPVLGDPITPDLSLPIVSALEKLMEAQAQELWLTKAEAMGMKKTTLAALTEGTKSLYVEAQRFIHATASLGAALLPGKAGQYVDMRVSWLTANAQRYMSDHLNEQVRVHTTRDRLWICGTFSDADGVFCCLSQTQPGEAIARLQIASEELSSALAVAKKHLHKSVEERLALAATEVETALAALEKDNETIYLETVPIPSQLAAIKSLVQIKPAELSLTGSFGASSADPWESLVSADEYVAVERFREEEAQMPVKLVAELGGTLMEHTAAAQAQLRELELPHLLDSMDTPTGEIPSRLLKKLEKHQEGGGVAGLEAAVRELEVKVDGRKRILASCDEILKREAEDDAACRAEHGAKWTAKTSEMKTQRLRKEWAATGQICGQEHAKLKQISGHLAGSRSTLELVSTAPDDLAKQMPSSLGAPKPEVVSEARSLSQQLRGQLGELEDICEARDVIQTRWAEAAGSVDIRGALRGSDPAARETLARAEMEKYEPVAADFRQSVAEQQRILSLIATAHAEFISLKPPSTEVEKLVQEFFDKLAGGLSEAGRLKDALEGLRQEREGTAKHFARLEPECIRYVEKRAAKREALLMTLGVAQPRVYRSRARRGRGGGGHQGGHRGGHRGRGSSGSPRGGGRDERRSSIEWSLQVSVSRSWWWQSGGADQFSAYSDADTALLEAAFLAYTNGGQTDASDGSQVVLSNPNYAVDLGKLRQVNVADERKSRPVQRRPIEENEDNQDNPFEVEGDGYEPPEPEPVAVPDAVPVPSSDGPPPGYVGLPSEASAPPARLLISDLESAASADAVGMGFSGELVDRVQADQWALSGSGYANVNELLPALLATEQQDQQQLVAPPQLTEAAPTLEPEPEPEPRLEPAAVPAIWEWQADRGWKGYGDQSAAIEAAYGTNLGRCTLEGGTHAIDFEKMRQVNVSDERRSRVVRRVEQAQEAAPPTPPYSALPSPMGLDAARPSTPPGIGSVGTPRTDSGSASPPVGQGTWEWKADRGWKSYGDQSARIEHEFGAGGGRGEHVLEGGSHAVDFEKMKQVNVTDRRRSRPVRRV